MCGIAGVFGHTDETTVRAMLKKLTHRGPDDEYCVNGADFTLGARRLSILDVAGGRQPLANERANVWAAQNGEIYNFPDLRAELLGKGHALHSHCDTECLPHLYEEHGTVFPQHLDGMFAVALWDDDQKLGVLARDRMGKKPLYYLCHGQSLYFASEIKALLEVPGFERRVNLEALHHYLSYKHIPHPLSIFEGIAILPPAHTLIFRPGSAPRLERYWHLDWSTKSVGMDETELVDRFLHLFRQGVRRRFMSDVPIGFFLSGGIDSALSTAVAAELSPGRIKTFTLTYGPDSTTPGKEEDRRWAQWTAQRYGTDHHEEQIVVGDFPANFRKILSCFDEPFAGVVSTYFLAQLIGKHVKVALAGDGADELFGSYLSHRLALPLANFAEYRRTGQKDLIRPFDDRPEYLARLAADNDWTWRSKLLVFNEDEKKELYARGLLPTMSRFDTADHLAQSFKTLSATDPHNRILEAEFGTIFPDQVLTFVDRLSMAHSLEVRSAFLDTEVVTFVAGLGAEWKIRAGETKFLLKQAARRFFPEEMVSRPKEGFVLPVNNWLQRDLEPYVRDTLAPSQLSLHGFFDPAVVGRWLDRFYSGQSDCANKILSLLAFQEWYSLFFPRRR